MDIDCHDIPADEADRSFVEPERPHGGDDALDNEVGADDLVGLERDRAVMGAIDDKPGLPFGAQNQKGMRPGVPVAGKIGDIGEDRVIVGEIHDIAVAVERAAAPGSHHQASEACRLGHGRGLPPALGELLARDRHAGCAHWTSSTETRPIIANSGTETSPAIAPIHRAGDTRPSIGVIQGSPILPFPLPHGTPTCDTDNEIRLHRPFPGWLAL